MIAMTLFAMLGYLFPAFVMMLGAALGMAVEGSDAAAALGAIGGVGGDLDGDGTFDFTYTPSGAEKVAEIYYRFRISPQFDLTPDFQWIANGGANPNADSVKVLGLRANIAY